MLQNIITINIDKIHLIPSLNRRADSCNQASDYIRHCVRQSWRKWEKIGASVQTIK
jgi:hypothetical protein